MIYLINLIKWCTLFPDEHHNQEIVTALLMTNYEGALSGPHNLLFSIDEVPCISPSGISNKSDINEMKKW